MTGINTNIAALMAKAYGQKANQKMLEPMQRLSSGLRINSASDDAAGLAVGTKMLASMKSYEMGVKNSIDMIGLLDTAEGALSEITDILMRIRELCIQSANGTYVNADRDKMQLEMNDLIGEMDRIAAHTKFNDVVLFDGSFYGQIVQTGKDRGDHVRIDIDKVNSCDLGRFWETYTFTNGDFENSGTTTKIADNVYSIKGWEIHNKRIELGEAAQGDEPAADSPATIIDRDGDVVDNLIGGWAIPRDPTPRPYKNNINVLVNPAVSDTTNDPALTYDTTYTGIVDPSPPAGVTEDGVFDVTIGAMESVSIVGSASTDNTNIMGDTYSGVTANVAAAGGDAATFDVTIGPMTVTPSANTTTDNVALMGQTYTNMTGVAQGGSVGTDAKFTVTVGQMTFTPAAADSTTGNTDIMGQTLTNVVSTSDPDHGGTDARFTVTIGDMTVSQAPASTDVGSVLDQTYTNVAGVGGTGNGAKFTVTVGEMTFTQAPATSNQAELFGTTYRNVAATTEAGGDAALFDVNIDVAGNITSTLVSAGSGYQDGQVYTIASADIGNNGNLSLTANAATVNVSMTNNGSGYRAGDVIAVAIGDSGQSVNMTVNEANVSVTLTNPGSGYTGYAGTVKILGTDIGGDAADDITLDTGDAEISVTVTDPGSNYRAGDIIRVNVDDNVTPTATVDVEVQSAGISVSLVSPGTGYKVGEQITIPGTEFGGDAIADKVVVEGNDPDITVNATSGRGYQVGQNVTLNWTDAAGNPVVAGANNLVTEVVKVPPGTDDSQRPVNYGDIESDGATGFSVENGVMKLNTGSMTSVYGWDIVHGPYIISSEAKEIKAGEKMYFDWKASGTNDAYDVFAYLLDVDTGATQVLLDETQENAGSTDWTTVETTVAADGNYKYVFINGTYDATGGMALGAEMYIDNIYIQRDDLPPEQQHTMCDIKINTVEDANNAIGVLDLSISQISEHRAKFGALVNRLRQSIEMSSSMGGNVKLARSRVFDAEYTNETSRLAKYQILAQASMAMLAQANKNNNSILQLLN
jgi:flagellin-like hook-associated protein FlgL